MLVYLIVLPVVASDQEDAAADAAAKAFLHARQAAHRSKLERMGRNTFREKACKRDMRFASGWINDVVYETSDPADLPDLAQKLAASPDTGRTAIRFGIGVCMQSNSSPGTPEILSPHRNLRISLDKLLANFLGVVALVQQSCATQGGLANVTLCAE